MIRNGSGLPTFAMFYEHPDLPGVAMVDIEASNLTVTVAFLDDLGTAVDVREYSVRENPELSHIVEFWPFDDVWNMDMVMSLVEPIDPQATFELAPLIPAYLQSLEAAS